MKKMISMLLVAVMLLAAAAVPVLAEGTGNGKITVEKTVKGQEYSIYQMATLDSYDVVKKAYLYTPVSAWKAFFEGYPAYFEFNEAGNIILKAGADVDAPAFAKAALAYAEEKKIDAVASKTSAADEESVVFDSLELGYYLVDSSLGALCGLTTTKPEATVEEKNAKPEVEKVVEEDSKVDNGVENDEWGKKNDADMFQTVNYKTTVTVQKGAQNYVLHDKMDAGLTFTGMTSVQVGGADVPSANYTVTQSTADGRSFEIAFADSYVSGLTDGTEIVVSYTAKLNENAVIAGDGNKNETWLTYGDSNSTTHDITTTYTYKFDLVKTDDGNKLLDGAEFQLYRGENGTEKFYFLKDDAGYYVVDAQTKDATDTLVVTDGKVVVRGLDSDSYSLAETKAPTGYNELKNRIKFKIEEKNLDATLDTADTTKYVSGGVQVVNKTGTALPETGGFGTVVFIAIGGLMMLGAGVLLVTKKRMSKIAD